MQITTLIPLQDLEKVFDIQYPKGMTLTLSAGEAQEEVEPFQGIPWTNVSADIISENWNAAYFFSPEAMIYFLPAYINIEIDRLEDVYLAYNALFSCMKLDEREEWMEWRRERWCKLSTDQKGLIIKWMGLLKAKIDLFQVENLNFAIEAFEGGVWD